MPDLGFPSDTNSLFCSISEDAVTARVAAQKNKIKWGLVVALIIFVRETLEVEDTLGVAEAVAVPLLNAVSSLSRYIFDFLTLPASLLPSALP